MPRTFCQHLTKDIKSVDVPKVKRSVSRRLAEFIRDRYDLDDDDMSDQDENSSGDSLHEITHQQQEAMDTSFNVFRILNMRPIHDR
jgi:hypothetical protein